MNSVTRARTFIAILDDEGDRDVGVLANVLESSMLVLQSHGLGREDVLSHSKHLMLLTMIVGTHHLEPAELAMGLKFGKDVLGFAVPVEKADVGLPF